MVIEQFKQAVERNDPDAVRRLLHSQPLLAERINEPWFVFDTPAIVIAANRGNRELVDVLLEYGADINVKSSWWAGGFGVLHHEHHDLSRYLIERGAHVDPHAAAALGMLELLRKMVEQDADIVNQRGPDGQVPLHYAVSPEIIDFLLDHGAVMDMRDIDHSSTPAQYAVNIPDKCRHLIHRGAQTDIFMACKLGDVELVHNILKKDPDALQFQVGKGDFTSVGGHIYEYVIGANVKPIFLAQHLGHEAITELMLSYSSVEQKFLLACIRADTETVRNILKEHPDIVQFLQPEDQSVIIDAARDHNADAVRLMLDVGFHVDARRNERSMTALHRAAERGDYEIVRLLIKHGASLEIRNEFGGTPMNSCIWGSLHTQDPQGDYAAVAEILIEAGVKLPDQAMGSEPVRNVLIRHGVRE
ncbi:ankyrin repeat domain-containing protein [Paenibacillus thalictri]|uniref:ankyrin repeat domain-containing protein n=1 Tax=Paenibacillus thalictri TaxID=2527873 RepID=UPI0013EF10F8|nr:ankyrin repeat domain-containing protein [Paenibacillus thalictri]